MEILGLIDLPFWLVAIISFVLSICLYAKFKQTYFMRIGIYQKPPTFLIGDMMGFAKQGPYYINEKMVEKHGKVFGTYIGTCPSLVISDPEMIKQIHVKQFNLFTDRTAFNMGEIWKSALTSAEGDTWRFIRHTVSPTFTSGKMRHMSPYIHRCLDTLNDILNKEAEADTEAFDIAPIMRAYTMDVICATGFGVEASAQTDPESPFVINSKKLLEMKAVGNPLFLFNIFFPDVVKIFPKLFTVDFVPKDVMDFFVSTTKQTFEDRKSSDVQHKDLLQLMVNAHKDGDDTTEVQDDGKEKKRGLTDDEVIINSIIFMIAGYDTTATALAWLIYELVLNPDVQDKLIESIDEEIGDNKLTYDNVFGLTYVDMVLNETLRMHSPALRITRMPSEDVEVCGYKIPKGMDCVYLTSALHFMSEYWEDPYTFNPERFSAENKHKINEYAYLPFGTGPRNCVGMRLAKLEVKMTIIGILQKFKLHRTDKLVVPMPPSKMKGNKPEHPIWIRLEKRIKT